MWRSTLLALAFLLLCPLAFSQSTTVSGQITDAGAQSWNNGTFTFTFVPSGNNPVGPYSWSGGTLNTTITGSLSATGSYSVSIPSNSAISPVNSTWSAKFCPQATSACFYVNNITITGGTQTVNATPPTILISLQTTVPPVLAYSTSEITGAAIGSQFYLLGTGPQVCQAASGNNCTTWASGGASPSSISSIYQVPTNGLLADYQMRSTDTVCSLPDYSGNANNATGCVGTSPTIIATTGGIQFNQTGAISLPAALNSALSIVVLCSFQGVGTTQNIYAFVDGSTSGGANVTRFALDNWNGSTTSQPSPLINNYRIKVTSNSILTTPTGPMDVINGTQTLTLTMDTANHIYINGGEVQDYGSGTVLSSAGLMTTGNYQLGGNSTNTTFFSGQMYRALFYNRVLTPAEIKLIASANTAYGSAHGVVTVSAPTGLIFTQNRLIFVGDSITRGFGVVNPWTGLVNTGANFNAPISQSVTGGLAQQMVNSESFSLFPFFNANAAKDAAVLWAGTNDIGSLTAAQVAAFNASFCRNAHTVIFRCGLITMLSRTALDASKDALNPLLRNELGQSADFVIDIGGTTQLGADGASATSAFQGDHVHPTEGSTWNVVSTLVTQGINRVYGNQNFTSANVYSSAAAAAVTATGGSEAGNVVTITFGANNPCLYGRQCTCTGFTPAGYNGLWFPASGSGASSLIVFSDTTGLGAVTVNGSCSIPEMQDADKYAILNFGAGNFTLETCQGYTGQNIYIKNINAVASTVVAFPGVTGGFPGTTWAAETIDGAANISVAQNAVLILQSQLVSQAAGGCTWKKIQNN